MPFQPTVHQELEIDGVPYRVAEHPHAPTVPFGQQGRKATVYQLVNGSDRRALKVFTPRFREPALVGVSEAICPFAAMRGLTAAERTVLTARRNSALLRQYEDLTYAVLMPWINGPTWTEALLDQRELWREDSANLARTLAMTLSALEEKGLAHCDLSGANVIIPTLGGSRGEPGGPWRVELVDLEEMYGPGIQRPTAVPVGSPGYAHTQAATVNWSPNADRFAGGVLLAEMLGWCDRRVRESAWGEAYFDPQEMQQTEARRFKLLQAVLEERWGRRIAGLFERTWLSDLLKDCPTFGEWVVALLDVQAQTAPDDRQSHTAPGAPTLSDEEAELASLFDDGAAALRRGEAATARELLAEVVRRRPTYQRQGEAASRLLAQVDQRRPQAAPSAAQPGPAPRVQGAPRSEAAPPTEPAPVAAAAAESLPSQALPAAPPQAVRSYGWIGRLLLVLLLGAGALWYWYYRPFDARPPEVVETFLRAYSNQDIEGTLDTIDPKYRSFYNLGGKFVIGMADVKLSDLQTPVHEQLKLDPKQTYRFEYAGLVSEEVSGKSSIVTANVKVITSTGKTLTTGPIRFVLYHYDAGWRLQVNF